MDDVRSVGPAWRHNHAGFDEGSLTFIELTLSRR